MSFIADTWCIKKKTKVEINKNQWGYYAFIMSNTGYYNYFNADGTFYNICGSCYWTSLEKLIETLTQYNMDYDIDPSI